jgi:hypothetical protein
MGKRRKQSTKSNESATSATAQSPDRPMASHPPAKNPALLIMSAILFALWFIFLMTTELLW